MSVRPFAWAKPASLTEAQPLLSATRRPKGGGFDLLDLMKKGVVAPEALVDLGACEGLRDIDLTEGRALRIGGGATLASIAMSETVRSYAPALAEAALEAATPQVRNRATLAGNVLQRSRCAYFRDPFFPCRVRGGDACPAMEGDHEEGAIFDNAVCCAPHASNLATALLAFGASLEILTGIEKNEPLWRVAPIAEFFTSPTADPLGGARIAEGEILARAILEPDGIRSAYDEVNHRQSFDWAAAAAAVVLRLDSTGKVADARIALGAVSPIPRRATAAEKALVGRKPDAAAAEAAAKAATEGATPLRDNGHKVRLVRAVVKRAVLRAAERGA
jgi:xanthine dehydrogenase YagS FAD-binding subunit